MADKVEKELSVIVASWVRSLDSNGNSGKTAVETIGSLLGIESYNYSINPNSTVDVGVHPGLYIAQAGINPEVIVFCIGASGRPDWGIAVLLGSKSGAFNFNGTGSYINIALSEDGNLIKITNKYAVQIRVLIKRLIL